ncbi:hypothetical protein [Leifsonia sp. A12D58]|uniref:hypothetical protein n=1 Tax=Leifsonia sp. A12D58 TaxID=3397674 RepID=UPI0039DFCD77
MDVPITIKRGLIHWRTRKTTAVVVAGVLAFGILSIGLPGAATAAHAETTLDEPTPPAVALSTPTPGSSDLTTPTPSTTTPAPPATSPPSTVQPAAAPIITAPASGIFISRDSTTVSGTRDAAHEIQVFSTAGGEPACIAPANGTTTWSCEVRLPSGPVVPLRAVVSGDAALNDSITVAVLAAPTVVGGPSGQSSSNGTVRGTGYPGATVSASVPSGAQCFAVVDGSGNWVCALIGTLTSGSHAVTANQKTDYSSPSSSNTSAAMTVLFDLDRPAPPVITAPSTGGIVSLAGSSYAGTGDDGARVIVYAGPQQLCTSVVSDGTWSCSAGAVPAGAYRVIAVQQDAAGNLSSGSVALTLTFANDTSSASPSELPAPVRPSDEPDPAAPPVPGTPSASAEPGTSSPTAAPIPPSGASGTGGNSSNGSLPALGVTGSWSDPTRFATAIVPLGFVETLPWIQALILTGAVLLLLVVPALLLSSTITRARGGKPLWRTAKLSGRNRAAVEFETAPTLRISRPLSQGAAVVAAAAFIVMSGPIADQPAYLRLLIGAILAVALVNAVSVFVPLWWSSRVLNVSATYKFMPGSLFIVGAAALASRYIDLNPAFLFGLLFGITVGATAAESDAMADAAARARELATRGRLAAVRAASLIILAVVGWLILPLLPPSTSLLATFSAEFVNIVVLTSLGSAAVLLAPLTRTSGRSLLAWSPPIWAGLAVSTLTVLFVSMTPVFAAANASGTATVVWLSAIGFALVSVCIWGWYTYIAPILR